jgi:tRNA 2-thiocytidine biosynthesis protein TtcA
MSSKIEKKLLHYTGKAIADYNMIQTNDTVLVCLSGGKDSFALLQLLRQLQIRANCKFDLFSLTIDQGFPGWQDDSMRQWLDKHKIPFEILKCDTLPIIKSKIADNKNYCSFCSRLRRGIIYSYAQKHGLKKIALGHNREDLISSLLMSILYSGEIRSMPPKLLTNTKKQIVIRPLVYCQEKDIIAYQQEQNFPCLTNSCELKANTTRPHMKALIDELASKNPKVPSNILHALQNIKISQLMDKTYWNFRDLEDYLHRSL